MSKAYISDTTDNAPQEESKALSPTEDIMRTPAFHKRSTNIFPMPNLGKSQTDTSKRIKSHDYDKESESLIRHKSNYLETKKFDW